VENWGCVSGRPRFDLPSGGGGRKADMEGGGIWSEQGEVCENQGDRKKNSQFSWSKQKGLERANAKRRGWRERVRGLRQEKA